MKFGFTEELVIAIGELLHVTKLSLQLIIEESDNVDSLKKAIINTYDELQDDTHHREKLLALLKTIKSNQDNEEEKILIEETSHNEYVNILDNNSEQLSVNKNESFQTHFVNNKAYRAVDVPSDGSCLFYSVALSVLLPNLKNLEIFHLHFIQLFGEEVQQFEKIVLDVLQNYDGSKRFIQSYMSGEILAGLINTSFRQRVADFIQEHPDDFKEFLTDNEGFVDYVKKLRQSDTWGDQLEIEAMSQFLKRRIVVYQEENQVLKPSMKHGDVYKKLSSLHLFYTSNLKGSQNNHYQYLIEPEYISVHSILSTLDNKKKNQDNFFNTVSDIKPDEKKTGIEKEEADYVKALVLADKEKDIQGQIDNLIKLGDSHLKKGNSKEKKYERGQFTRAMALYYSAFNRSITEEQKKSVSEKIQLAEQSFLTSIKTESEITSQDEIKSYKKLLSDIREWCKEELKIIDEKYDITEIEDEKEKQPIENERAKYVRKIQEHIQEEIRVLLEKMVTASIMQIGGPPCKYAIIGFGSFAECRMTPYSDLEFGILIEDEKEEYKEYFRNLTELIHLKVIHLGETVLRPMKIEALTDNYFDNSSKNGLKFDSFRYGGCKTPLGSRKKDGTIEFELIHAPKEMAQFQRLGQEALEKQHIPIGITSAEYIMGNKQLFINCQKEVKNILELGDKKPHLERGLRLLEEDMHFFKINLHSDYEEGKIYDVKREIYRLSDRVVSALCLYLGIYEASGWKKIEYLEKIIGKDNVIHMKVVFSLASEMRMRVYLSCYEQQEKWLPEKIGKLFNQKDSHAVFFRYYYRALVLEEQVRKFLEKKNICLFKNIIYFDDSFWRKSLIFKRLLNYQAALQYALKYLDDNLEEDTVHHTIGCLYVELGKAEEAIIHYNKALALCKHIYDDQHPKIANCLAGLGNAYRIFGQYQKAFESYEQALAISKNIYNENPDIARDFNNLAAVLYDLGDLSRFNEAIDYLNKALILHKNIYGDNHRHVATDFNNLGGIYCVLGEHKKAIEYHQQALIIDKELYGDVHPDVARDLSNIGEVWRALGKHKKAIEHFEQAVAIDEQIYGDAHPNVGIRYNNLAETLHNTDRHKESLRYFKKALKILKKSYGNDHPQVATILNNVGTLYQDIGKPKDAIACYEQVLILDRKAYGGDKHIYVAGDLNNLGNICNELCLYQKAIQYCSQALLIHKELNNNHNDASVATYYNNLGEACFGLDEYEKAIEYFEQALYIRKSIYGDKHFSIAVSFNGLGKVWNACGKSQKAIDYHEKAVLIDQAVYGSKHTSVATGLNNLGYAYFGINKPKKAIEYCEHALIIYENAYGDDNHPNIANTVNNLGLACHALGYLNKAIEYFNRAFSINTEVYGNKHLKTIECQKNLENTYEQEQGFKKSLEGQKSQGMFSTQKVELKDKALENLQNEKFEEDIDEQIDDKNTKKNN